MSKSNIFYCDDTLVVNMDGKYTYKRIQKLKNQIYLIVDNYGVNHIIINVKAMDKSTVSSFYDMLNINNGVYDYLKIEIND